MNVEQATLFVVGFPFATTEDDLSAIFAEYGPVASIKIIVDRDTGRSRGFGFVTMSRPEDASAALEAAGMIVGDREIKVDIARPRGTVRRQSASTRVA